MAPPVCVLSTCTVRQPPVRVLSTYCTGLLICTGQARFSFILIRVDTLAYLRPKRISACRGAIANEYDSLKTYMRRQLKQMCMAVAATAVRLLVRAEYGAFLERDLLISTPFTSLDALRECVHLLQHHLSLYDGPHCRCPFSACLAGSAI